LSDAALLLERGPDGKYNWEIGDHRKSLALGRFAVDTGTVRIRDAERGIAIDANVRSAQSDEKGQLVIRFDAKGVWEKNDFVAHGTAATPFSRASGDRPYRLDVEAKSGTTAGTFAGNVIPSTGDVDGALTVSGNDLSALDAIVPFEFSRTPPYRLTANLKHAKQAWSLAELSAKIGSTDLAGTLSIDRNGKRTRLHAELASQAATYNDLRALVGYSGEGPAAKAGKAVAGARKSADERAAGSGDLSRLQLLDAKIALKAKRFTIGKWRFTNATAQIDVDGGVLKMKPVEGLLAGGRVGGTLAIDARDKIAQATADLTMRDAELAELFPVLKKRGAAGKASGRSHLTASGKDIRELLESTSGELTLLSAGGTSGVWSSGLADLDLAQASKLLFRGSATSPIRCAAADFGVERGIMRAKTLVVDTEDETIVGHGAIDLPDQRYDLEFESQSKTPSLLAYKGPVLVEGTFRHPNVHAKSGPLLARVGAAVGLAVLNPVAALLPLVDVGGAAGVSCRSMITKTKGELRKLKEDANGNGGANAVAQGTDSAVSPEREQPPSPDRRPARATAPAAN